MIGGWNGYSWLPRGGHETIQVTYAKKSVKLVGALGNGWFHIAIVASVNSTTVQKFMDGLIEKVGKVAAVMDNAACHHSNATDKYEADSRGMFERIFLPAHTPQLNPIETLWRDLKRALAGGCFGSVEDLQAAIFDIVNNGELPPTKLQGYMMPEGAKTPPEPIKCTIIDMTDIEAKTEAAAA